MSLSNIDQIQKEANKLLSGETSEQLYQSVEGITRLLQAIIKTDGNHWAAHVVDTEGNPVLTPEEQRRFTNLLEPFVPAILSFFKAEQRGGEEIIPPPAYNIQPATVPLPPSYNNQKQNAATPPPSYNNNQKQNAATPPPSYNNQKQNAPLQPNETQNKNQGVDNLYEAFFNKIAAINSKVNGYASQYGILKYEKEGDHQYNLKAPAALRVEYPFLEPLYIPVRTLVFLIQLLIDVLRYSAAMSGRDQSRKILSIAASILDLLRGDWKKAILSLIGYYGTTPLLVGEIGKIYLSVFRTFSPTLQRRFTYGALDATKSLIVGFLLSIFQFTAPLARRKELIPIFQKIALKKKEMDGMLTDQDLLPRPDYMIPSFEDLNNLQVLLDDPVFICSIEAKNLVEEINQSSIINMVLQLLRIPVTEKMQKYTCSDGYKPIAVKMVEEGQRTNTLPHPVTTPKVAPIKGGRHRTVRSSTWKTF
uniref:Uncharacterized protein n=1 Tax=viral metagenome TaxID=1070528 RepID=A0A6C0KR06_9ZZZZ